MFTPAESLVGGVRWIFGEAVHLQARDGKRIRNHETLEAPVFAQHVGQQPVIAARGHVVQIHIGAHEAARTRLLRRMERHQVDVVHQFFRHIGGVVVAPAVRCAVTGKVLHAGQHTARSEMRTLESEYLRARHGSAEVRIFTRAFHDPAPARVTRNIDHRRESPVDARGPRVLRRQMLRPFLHRGIPRRSHRQRDRKDRAVPVNNIESEKNGNVQAGLVHREMLEPLIWLTSVSQRTEPTLPCVISGPGSPSSPGMATPAA